MGHTRAALTALRPFASDLILWICRVESGFRILPDCVGFCRVMRSRVLTSPGPPVFSVARSRIGGLLRVGCATWKGHSGPAGLSIIVEFPTVTAVPAFLSPGREDDSLAVRSCRYPTNADDSSPSVVSPTWAGQNLISCENHRGRHLAFPFRLRMKLKADCTFRQSQTRHS